MFVYAEDDFRLCDQGQPHGRIGARARATGIHISSYLAIYICVCVCVCVYVCVSIYGYI